MSRPAFTILLRDATRHAHDSIESNFFARKLEGGGLTVADYAAYLAALWGFHQKVEPVIEGVLRTVGYDFKAAERSPELLKDLEALGWSGELSQADVFPRIETPAQAWGVAYVMEGSRLGGKVLVKQVRDQLGDRVDGATSYFDGYGADHGERWRGFLQALGEGVTDEADQDCAIQAANEAFATLETWIGRCDPERV